jgi:RNA polymerase sigma factor (sigma-70 family)
MGIHTETQFSALFREHYDDLLRFVRRRASDHVVDDIVSETWRRRADIPQDARPWLFRTARNVMMNASRSLLRQEAVAVKIGTRIPDLPGYSIDDQIDIQTAWRSLSPVDQEVLALSIWEDLSQAEAAAVLSCSRAAYAMRLTRAKRHMHALMNTSAPTSALPAL